MFVGNNDLLFGDSYPGRTLVDDYAIKVFHSLSKVSQFYTGALVKIIRDSDSATKDFYPDSNYELSMDSEDGAGTSLSTWIGANSGYIVKWYNQGSGGSTWDVYHDTPSRQPRIVNAGSLEIKNGKATARFDTADWLRSVGNKFTDADYGNAWTYFCVTTPVSAGQYTSYYPISGLRLFTDSRATPNRHFISGGLTANLSTAYNNTNQVLKTGIIDGASTATFDNGNPGGSGTIGSYTNIADYGIGSTGTKANPLLIQEFFIISSNASGDRVAIETEMINYYSIPT